MPTSTSLKKYGPLCVIAIFSLCLFVWGVTVFRIKRAIHDAQDLLQNGYSALAAERIDPFRHKIVEYQNGCNVMIAAYYRSRTVDRLQWSAEACLRAQKSGVEALIALAGVQEFTGRDTEAMQILNQALARYGSSPDVLYRIAAIEARQKNVEAAAQAYLQAAQAAGNNYQITMEGLQYCSASGHWKEARQIAGLLKTVPTGDPEVKLIIARALRNGGDAAGSKSAFEEAQQMLGQKPDLRKQFEKIYADLFNGGSQQPQH